MLATSSRCSFRNQSKNCAPTRSFSSRASAASRTICSVTVRSCLRASATGATASENSFCGSVTAGILTCFPESRRYWTSIIAWFRSSSAWR